MPHCTGSFPTKVFARRVSRLLSDQHKEILHCNFRTLEDEGDVLLFNQTMTRDETWICHWMPKSKRQSMVWKGKNEEKPKKQTVVELAGKIMPIVLGF